MSLFSVQPLLTESGIHNRFRDLCAVHPELRNDTGIIVNLQPHGVGITFNLIPPPLTMNINSSDILEPPQATEDEDEEVL